MWQKQCIQDPIPKSGPGCMAQGKRYTVLCHSIMTFHHANLGKGMGSGTPECLFMHVGNCPSGKAIADSCLEIEELVQQEKHFLGVGSIS